MRLVVSCITLLACLLLADSRIRAEDAAVNATALEALQRLKGIDLEANPTVKTIVVRLIESTRGTPRFVELVRDFNLEGQDAGLLEVAARHPEDPAAAEAMRLLLKRAPQEALRTALREDSAGTGPRPALVQALAACGDPAAVPFLATTARDTKAAASTRALAIRGLARTEAGARVLLGIGREGALDDAARTTATLALAQSRWPAIREDAVKVFPLPRTADGVELPSLPELSRQRGDASRGAVVFRSEQAACIKCHRVGGEGVDFGPALTEIGTKLARQALYEAILDPSAGISFGYEAWVFETKAGEESYGLLASETADEVAVKLQTGAVVKLRPADITRREKQKLSVMPAGLAQILTRQQLVDVVEYLAGLRAK